MSAGRVVGLHHVQLCCPPGGEDAARAFYGGLLGLTEVAKPPELAARGGVWFRDDMPNMPDMLGPAGGVEVHIGAEPGFRPAGRAHPALVVRGLDALAGRLAGAGHPVSWDRGLPGYRRCHTLDPHGNRVELLEPA